MSKFQRGRKVIDSLIEAGIADHETQRVLIDIPVDGMAKVYVVKVGTEMVSEILPMLIAGADIKVA